MAKLAAWRMFVNPGSARQVERGAAVTQEESTTAPKYWFAGATTTIVGAAPARGARAPKTESLVSWSLAVDQPIIRHFSRGFLVIGCLRYFGGLHCTKKNKRVDVMLNGHHVDGFALRIRPLDYSDYFHRVPPPADLPHVFPISNCQTVYAWPITRELLASRTKQQVEVRVDYPIRWDIDHVALLIQSSRFQPRVFLSHSHSDKAMVRSLARALSRRGIRVWLDEAEMRAGDSLIQKLQAAIDEVDLVLAVLTPASASSPWVRKELDIAMNHEIKNRKVKVVPILRRDCQLPPFLTGKLYVDFTSPYHRQKNLPRLLRSIREQTGTVVVEG